MAFETFKGSFTKSTAGAPVDDVITGVGFTPKVILFFATAQTAAGTAGEMILGWGITDGTTDFAVCESATDAVTPSDANLVMASKALTITDKAGVVVAECDLKTLGADGFTVTWTTNDGNAYIIHFFCIGGDDITSAATGTFAADSSPTTQVVTGVGFQPDCLIFISSERTAVGSSVNAAITFGFAVSSTQRGVMCGYSEDNSTASDTAQSQADIFCIRYVGDKSSVPSDYGRADFVSMDSDGFTIEWTSAVNSAFLIGYIALKGGQYHIGTASPPTGTAPQSQAITGVGFTPKGILLMSTRSNLNGTIASQQSLSLGAASGAGVEGCVEGLDQDDKNPTVADSITKTDKALVTARHLSSGAVSIRHECDLTSFDSDGYTLNWTTTSGDTTDFMYLCMGDAVTDDDTGTGASGAGVAVATAPSGVGAPPAPPPGPSAAPAPAAPPAAPEARPAPSAPGQAAPAAVPAPITVGPHVRTTQIIGDPILMARPEAAPLRELEAAEDALEKRLRE